VVEDLQSMRDLVSRNLRILGYAHQTAVEDTERAWSLIQREEVPFDIVICDWNRSSRTGLDLLSRVRADSRFEKTVFILLTEASEIAQLQEALQAGIDAYLIKPFSPQHLEKKFFDTYNRTAPRFGRQKLMRLA
jgi:two-component system chemotaxis response regulator CheY